jgi:hypothetical protein
MMSRWIPPAAAAPAIPGRGQRDANPKIKTPVDSFPENNFYATSPSPIARTLAAPTSSTGSIPIFKRWYIQPQTDTDQHKPL